ncbi:MAG: TraB/GumN family protein [Clostridiaceae bacterium]|nr:TraB/GumN family protein [Clostridiaceae bacterium]
MFMDSGNITKIQLEDKEIILIGTAHVSKESAKEVQEVIEKERPDSVCVELDEQRYKTIMDKNKWKKMDIFKIIKEKKSTFLLINLIISTFQKRIAKQFDIQPGQEMIQAIKSANEVEAKIVLADRNIQVTFLRIWHGIGLKGKLQLLTHILFGFLSDEEITEEELENLKSKDTLTSMLDEFTKHFPKLKTFLVDERDMFLSHKIKKAPGQKVVAVLGAAHIPGVLKEIHRSQDLSAISKVPAKSNHGKIVSWIIPILIVGIIGSTFYFSQSAAIDSTLSWIIWNGSLSALGALAAFGHPLSILTAFVLAPLTSLNPFFGAGWMAGLVEAFIRRPNVQDFENLSEDVFTVKGFWKNKVTRILLVVALTNLGSVLGTAIGGAEVIRLFFKTIRGA